MTNKKSLASHKSLGRREVDVQVNVEKKVKTRGFEGEPTAIDVESTVLKRERGDIPRKVNNDHDADMASLGESFCYLRQLYNLHILSFSRNSSKALCVLSATGTVSSVVLCQSGCGQFEILHLSGSFTHTEVGGKNRRIGNLLLLLSSKMTKKTRGQVLLQTKKRLQISVGVQSIHDK
ncbi:hypothetical protein ACOSQ3_016362 [Xanthoceras sorbifolium]